MIHFRVDGEAVGKGRPRVTYRGGYAHAYTQKRTKEFEDRVRQAFVSQHKGDTPVYDRETALRMTLLIGCKVPKSYSKRKREAALFGDIHPTKRPDVDNICKAILDALNSLAFVDDSQVTALFAEKVYAEEPYVVICIAPIEGEPDGSR